jgi:hypothetical protein
VTPCFRRFSSALTGSHSNSRLIGWSPRGYHELLFFDSRKRANDRHQRRACRMPASRTKLIGASAACRG